MSSTRGHRLAPARCCPRVKPRTRARARPLPLSAQRCLVDATAPQRREAPSPGRCWSGGGGGNCPETLGSTALARRLPTKWANSDERAPPGPQPRGAQTHLPVGAPSCLPGGEGGPWLQLGVLGKSGQGCRGPCAYTQGAEPREGLELGLGHTGLDRWPGLLLVWGLGCAPGQPRAQCEPLGVPTRTGCVSPQGSPPGTLGPASPKQRPLFLTVGAAAGRTAPAERAPCLGSLYTGATRPRPRSRPSVMEPAQPECGEGVLGGLWDYLAQPLEGG